MAVWVCVAVCVPAWRVAAAETQTASPPVPLTLEAAIQEAMAHNASLQAASLRLQQAEAGVRLARAIRKREWRLEGAANAYVEQNADPQYWFRHEELVNELSVTLADGGKARGEVLVALADAIVARAEYDQSAADLRLQVASAYFAAVQTVEEERWAEEGGRLLRGHLDVARTRVGEGAAPQLDVVRAEAGLAEAEAELRSAQAETARAWYDLVALLGRSPSTEVGTVDTVLGEAAASLPPDQACQAARDGAPVVRVRDAELAVARAGLKLAKSQHKPDLSFALGYTLGNDVTDSRQIITGGFRWSLPLNDHGAHEAREDSAEAAILAADQDLIQAKIGAESAVLKALAGLDGARERLRAMDQVVRLQEAVHDRSATGYEEGAISMRDVLDAGFDLTSARRDRVQAACDLQTRLAELEALVGAASVGRPTGAATPEAPRTEEGAQP